MSEVGGHASGAGPLNTRIDGEFETKIVIGLGKSFVLSFPSVGFSCPAAWQTRARPNAFQRTLANRLELFVQGCHTATVKKMMSPPDITAGIIDANLVRLIRVHWCPFVVTFFRLTGRAAI